MRRFAVVALAAAFAAGCHHSVPPAPAVPAAAVQAGPSLYERLGGRPAIRTVVDTFTTRVQADTRINAFFRGIDLDTFKELLAEQICQASGGPCIYSGRPMDRAHKGMHITNAQFDALVEDLSGALDANHVGAAEKSQLLAILGGLRGQIVGK